MTLATNGLTPMQEKYAQGLAMGMTQADAYRASYNCQDWLDSSIWCEASKLADHPMVIQRVKEIQEASQTRQVMSITKRKVRLSTIAEKDTVIETQFGSHTTYRDALQAIDTLNKMDRLYAEPFEMGDGSSSISLVIRGPATQGLIDRLLGKGSARMLQAGDITAENERKDE